MSSERLNTQTVEPNGRPVGGTEYCWCQAVPGGTGIAVLALLVSKAPDITCLQNAIHKLQNSHPILKSRLNSNTTTNSISFITSSTPFVQIKSFTIPSNFSIIESLSIPNNHSISPFHLIHEHELNQNTWSNSPNRASCNIDTTNDMFFATIYALPSTKWVVVFRLHVSACDRTTAVSLLRELLMLLGDQEDRGGLVNEMGKNKGEVSLKIEDLIPNRKAKKPLWARGVDMLNYSVASLKPHKSEIQRYKLAGLMAAYSSKHNQRKKYGVVTLTDCHSILDPPLCSHHFGFYHSAILNTHLIKGGEKLWELAQKTYMAFANSKNSNKHFSDMADLNFLMCKTIENPELTTSSSLRTSFMSVFEDPVIDQSNDMQQEVGLEDYMGCASVHGVGPSIAIFDIIRDGKLDCVCIYPAPLHSREQMQELVDNMKAVLVYAIGANYVK
uniref:Condensation domain-containing protein n=1 Tax=Fagus sylvatica TaxID=28930 RepID=A0A2N9IE94_FAGSY